MAECERPSLGPIRRQRNVSRQVTPREAVLCLHVFEYLAAVQRVKVVVLGSGTTVPSVHRSAPAYYVSVAGKEILIDCGSGSLVQLERAGKTYKTIDAAFFTHTHPDHVGDLVRLIHALKATPGFRRQKPLALFGPKGFRAFCESCIAPLVSKPKEFALEVAEVAGAVDFGGLEVTTTPTLHVSSLASIAYRFDENGRSVVFSGDCDYDPALVRFCSGADLLILDCSYTEDSKAFGHLSARECGRLAKEAKVRRLVLSHLYPLPDGEKTRLEECRTVFDGDVRLAEDLLAIAP